VQPETGFTSSRAAGQLGHIPGEGLRGELQPLDHRQVREQLVVRADFVMISTSLKF
jgi:hypothetical protein